ncbi:MAG: OstA-like protein [Bacteroidota bacterium]
MRYQRIILFLLVAMAGFPAVAQKKVKLLQGDRQIGAKRNGERVDMVIGNVIFKHKETLIYCDTAITYRKRSNQLEAFGHVRIEDGDSITITSKKLYYDGNTKDARLRDDVVFNKIGQGTLYTDFLDYDQPRQQAYYFNGGKLVDSTNVLTSEKGYYNTVTNVASFKKDVVSTNPDYTLKSDTLQYNTDTKIIFFRAPTEVIDTEGNIFNYAEGIYNTNEKRSDLDKGDVKTENYILTGDKMNLDDIRKYYTATKNVFLIAKNNDVIITGEKGVYDKKTGITKVYENALLKKLTSTGDTIYMSADTLVSIDSDIDAEKRLLAYPNVKIFKSDLQGKADSMAYHLADSMMYCYIDPVIWTEGNQMTADSISIAIANNTIDKLFMKRNSFVISEDTLANHNQIKGRDMIAFFNEEEIKQVNVYGNGESLYFALDETDSYVMGMNKILCSNMAINFKANDVDNITFYIKPDANFIPPHELKESDKKLKDFVWRESEKPAKNEVLRIETKEIQMIEPTEEKVLPSKVELELEKN